MPIRTWGSVTDQLLTPKTAAGADCNQNGVPDECDIEDGTSEDCNGNSIPDLCEIVEGEPDCNTNGVPDECDIAGGMSNDANANGIPDECEDLTDWNWNGILNDLRHCDTLCLLYILCFLLSYNYQDKSKLNTRLKK